jgi:hypothetical protein
MASKLLVLLPAMVSLSSAQPPGGHSNCPYSDLAGMTTAVTAMGCDLDATTCTMDCANQLEPLVTQCGQIIRQGDTSGQQGGRGRRLQPGGGGSTGGRGGGATPGSVMALAMACMQTLHPESDSTETGRECSDGTDNDGDGTSDCDDVDCCYTRECMFPMPSGGGTPSGGGGGMPPSPPAVSAVCQAAQSTGSACTSCSTQDEFQSCANLLNAACCGSDGSLCTAGVPTSCSTACAAAVLPTLQACGTYLSTAGWGMQAVSLAFNTMATLCESGH